MGSLRIFLDANILYSASVGGASFDMLWKLAETKKIVLVTSPYCALEAERNLTRKRPDALIAYETRRERVVVAPDADADQEDASLLLPLKDRPVYAAAVAAQADVLLTGDTRHFGVLMTRGDLPIRVRTVRAFLIERDD